MLRVAGPIADIVLLRGLFAERPLTVGSVLPARVLDHQTLLLAGVRIPARIPAELAAGEAIRVEVQEVSAERFVLQVVAAPPPEAAVAGTPTAAYALALPGGAQARVHVDPEASGEGGSAAAARRSITLRFDSPTLGRLDFAIDLDAGAVASTVHVTAGDPAAVARAAAPELEAALTQATSRPASVAIRERGETLDVRA
jgi:hypothetical protein